MPIAWIDFSPLHERVEACLRTYYDVRTDRFENGISALSGLTQRTYPIILLNPYVDAGNVAYDDELSRIAFQEERKSEGERNYLAIGLYIVERLQRPGSANAGTNIHAVHMLERDPYTGADIGQVFVNAGCSAYHCLSQAGLGDLFKAIEERVL